MCNSSLLSFGLLSFSLVSFCVINFGPLCPLGATETLCVPFLFPFSFLATQLLKSCTDTKQLLIQINHMELDMNIHTLGTTLLARVLGGEMRALETRTLPAACRTAIDPFGRC
jgi:hypothetical protein